MYIIDERNVSVDDLNRYFGQCLAQLPGSNEIVQVQEFDFDEDDSCFVSYVTSLGQRRTARARDFSDLDIYKLRIPLGWRNVTAHDGRQIPVFISMVPSSGGTRGMSRNRTRFTQPGHLLSSFTAAGIGQLEELPQRGLLPDPPDRADTWFVNVVNSLPAMDSREALRVTRETRTGSAISHDKAFMWYRQGRTHCVAVLYNTTIAAVLTGANNTLRVINPRLYKYVKDEVAHALAS